MFFITWGNFCKVFRSCKSITTVNHEVWTFFTHDYFINETVSQSNVSTGPMKMFHFGAWNYECLSKECSTFCSHGVQVWQNWRHFSGFWKLGVIATSERWRRLWTNLSHWNTGSPSSRCEELSFSFNLYANVQLVKCDMLMLPPSFTIT